MGPEFLGGRGERAQRRYIEDALSALGGEPAFWDRLQEYGVAGGGYFGSVTLTRVSGPGY